MANDMDEVAGKNLIKVSLNSTTWEGLDEDLTQEWMNTS